MAKEKYATAPEALKGSDDRNKAFLAAASLETGIATKYWLELVAYPPGSARSLWLLLNNVWRHLDNPNVGTQDSVQAAFCNCPDRLEVAVWATGDVIVGLVVRSK
ncbi:MAG: hypothetical protein ACXWID_10085 [Pyrinomonadaceae bacterium]